MRWMLGAGLGLALVMSRGTAAAAPVTFSTSMNSQIILRSGTAASWPVTNKAGTDNGTPAGTCSSDIAGLAVQDGILDPDGVPRGDSLDNGLTVWLDDVQFASPDTVDVTDETLTSGPVTMSGLEVTVQYKAFASLALLRAIVTLHNPTGDPIEVSFRLMSNFGSDGATEVRDNGAKRSWVVTSDDATDPSDPVVVMVGAGPSSAAPRTGVPFNTPQGTSFICSETQGSAMRYSNLIVPPGESLSTMQFIGLAASNAQGIALGETFDTNPASDDELVADRTAEQLAATINWNFFGEFVIAGGNASWEIGGFVATSNRQATGGECVSVPGVGLDDAQVDTPPTTDPIDFQLLFVGGESFRPPVLATQVDQTVTVGPATLAGLDVTLRYTALPGSPTLRTFATIHNPTGAAVATTVQLATNFGSDVNTLVAASSSGDGTVATGDRWTVTADDPIDPGDPVNTCVVSGPGTPVATPELAADVFSCSGTQGLLATFALNIGPGQTQSLLFFSQVHEEIAAATADVTVFDGAVLPGGDLLAGLDNPALAGVVNWTTCRGATHAEAICRVDGLSADATANGPAGKTLDKLLARLVAAKTALEKSNAAAGASKKGPARRGLKAASGALKSFEKLLKSKKTKTVLADAVRSRLSTTSTDLRTQLKNLPLAI